MLRVSIFPPSAPSLISSVAMDETSPPSPEIVAEHYVKSFYPYYPTGYGPSNQLTPHLAALEVAVTAITLTIALGDSPKWNL